MKIQIFLLLALILSLSLVSATRFEINNFKLAVVEDSGSLTTTEVPVTGVSVQGYVCGNANCSILSNTLWSGQTLFTANNSITLSYPTLQSPNGYGVYYFKPGYLPYEVPVTLWGTLPSDPVGPYNRYMAQKATCTSGISDFTVAINGTELLVNATLHAPINNSGPLTAIPSSLEDYYDSEVIATLIVNDSIENKIGAANIMTIPFSSKMKTSFSGSLPAGNYTLTLRTNVNEEYCISSPDNKIVRSITIVNSTSNNEVTLPTISIISPESRTYTSNLLHTILLSLSSSNATSVVYNFDNGANQTYFSQTFIEMSLGTHTLHAFAINSAGIATAQVTFTIANTPNNQTNQSIPTISIVSPESRTYTSSLLHVVLLNISSTNATSVIYNLNNGINQTYFSPTFLELPVGLYNLKAFAINSVGTASAQVTFVIASSQSNESDTTPPNTVSNLTAINNSNTSITWSWINPVNSDFYQTILYLNGINLVNTSSNNYTFSNLLPNTQYTLTINTQDLTGNINRTNVSNTNRTLANSGSGTGGTTGSSGSGSSGSSSTGSSTGNNVRAPPILINSARVNSTSQYDDAGAIMLNTTQNKSSWMQYLILSLLVLIILIVIIAIVATLNK